MLKLNKCRTLYAFTEAALAGIQGQTQQASTQGQESASAEQAQANQTDNSKENKQESQKQDSKTAKEQTAGKAQKSGKQKSVNKTEAQAKGSEPNKNEDSNKEKDLQETGQENQNKEEQTGEQQQQSQYLFFNADEFIITTYQYENGWWYGYLDNGEAEADRKLGFFPSNYVQVIEDYSQQNLAEQQEIENMKANADMNQAFTWDDYAKISYMDDTQILVEERMKKMNDYTAPENRNPDGILGYKKIKIHESRSHAVNPSKGGTVQTSQIAVKDQSQVAKAYRQMNHYFDYDAWIDERNKNPAQKAKADPSKKKEKKKVLNW